MSESGLPVHKGKGHILNLDQFKNRQPHSPTSSNSPACTLDLRDPDPKMPDTYQPANLLKLAYLPAISRVLSFNHNVLDRKKNVFTKKISNSNARKKPFSNKISNISIYSWSQRPRPNWRIVKIKSKRDLTHFPTPDPSNIYTALLVHP